MSWLLKGCLVVTPAPSAPPYTRVACEMAPCTSARARLALLLVAALFASAVAGRDFYAVLGVQRDSDADKI